MLRKIFVSLCLAITLLISQTADARVLTNQDNTVSIEVPNNWYKYSSNENVLRVCANIYNSVGITPVCETSIASLDEMPASDLANFRDGCISDIQSNYKSFILRNAKIGTAFGTKAISINGIIGYDESASNIWFFYLIKNNMMYLVNVTAKGSQAQLNEIYDVVATIKFN